MAHTNQTHNYELSQFLGTDKPAWLVDYNGDMEKIDLGLKAAKDVADAAKTEADQGAIDIAALTLIANSAEAKASAAVSDIADVYDSTSTYSVDDYVTYNSILYTCNTDITVPESFDGNHWTRTTVDAISTSLKDALNQLNIDLSDLINLTAGLNVTGIGRIELLNKHFMIFNCTSSVPINSNIIMPNYTKGIFVTAGGDSASVDGFLLAVDINANLYVAFRNGSTWNYARKL